MRISDWSSDVCSSDLIVEAVMLVRDNLPPAAAGVGQLFQFLDHRFGRSAQDDMIDQEIIVDVGRRNILAAVGDDAVEQAELDVDFLQIFMPGDRKSTRLNSSH